MLRVFEASINSSFEDPNLAGTIIQVEQTFVILSKVLAQMILWK